MSATMQAVWYERKGAAAEVLPHGEMDVPAPAAGELLVRLAASGVNPSDVKARAGSRPMGFDRVIPHSDGAGIVEAVGDGGDPSLIGT
ncbi:MAG: NADPH:quinone reductase, partial [Pseudomonadota bacterium]|nr:NADPH:quinone reductase [Pseudomonadota bacterium]